MNLRKRLLFVFRFWMVFVLLMAFSIVPVSQAAGAIIYVDDNAVGANDGSSWTDAYTDLQDALAAAESTDQIWVAEGTYKPHATDEDISFVLVDGVAIYGGFTGTEVALEERNSDPATNNTILSGDIGVVDDTSDNSDTVVSSSKVSPAAILDGFTITDGFADGQRGLPHPDRSGGGMHNDDSSPALNNLIFTDNHADWGGAMLNNKSNPSMTNVVFSGNTANNTGGGLFNKGSNPTLGNVEFTDNTAIDGGGMYNDGSIPELTQVDFFMNTASGNGGALYNNASNAVMVNVAFKGDTASAGGGVYNNTSNSTLTNGLFVGETATSGGAMFNLDSSPTLTNLSLSGNYATTGGGLYNDNSSPSVNNTILWGNTDEGASVADAQIYNINLSTPTISHSLVQGSGGGGGNLDVDPEFIRNPDDGGDGWGVGSNDDYGDLHLKTGSLAINAGDNSLVPAGITFDLDDNARIVGTIVDMGAYEYYDALPIAVDDDFNGDEDTTLNVPAPGVLDNDYQPNGDSFSITENTQPANGAVILNHADGSFEYTPVGDFFGDDTFTYTICEDVQTSDCDTATVTISVAAGTENDPPVALDDNYNAFEDTQLNVPAPGVLDNDTDPDGDNITIDSNTQPANGSVTLNADGSFTYMPNQDYFGADTFNYTICDDATSPLCDSAVVSITVAAGTENDPPVAEDDSYDAFKNISLNVPAPGVLDNDYDPDGDNITIDSNTQPTNGSVTLNADGSFAYTPDQDYLGLDTFNYTICDDATSPLCDSAVVTITVGPVTGNIPPVAVDDNYDAFEDTPLNVPAPGVLDNDSDPDGDNFVIDSNTQPTNGAVTLNPDGSFTYTPDNGYFGQDTFNYTICDDGTPSLCDSATVTINVDRVTFEIYLPLIYRN